MKILLRFAHFIFLIACIVIQLSFFEQLKIFNINVDIILVAVIGIAVFDGGIYGLVSGFVAGMLLDLMVGRVVGVSALLYSMSGYFTGRIMSIGFKKKIYIFILLIFFFTEANLLLSTGIYYLFSISSDTAALGLEMIINPICNIVIMFLVFPLLKAGSERSEEIGFTYKDQI
ncbi:MAG: rod shape-determining protein MreD [Actinobacteria bacterium]|nr:rod shape-determining protein MreD [Actinomycetota bacterium]